MHRERTTRYICNRYRRNFATTVFFKGFQKAAVSKTLCSRAKQVLPTNNFNQFAEIKERNRMRNVNEYRSSGSSPPRLTNQVQLSDGVIQKEETRAAVTIKAKEGRSEQQEKKSARRLLTPDQAAEYLNCSTITVRRLIWDGRLPSVKWDRRQRLDILDLERFVEDHKN